MALAATVPRVPLCERSTLMKICIILALTFIVTVLNAFAQPGQTNWLTALAQRMPHHTGTVRYPSGEPAAGVRVTFYPDNYTYTSSGSWLEDYSYHEAITDKNGWYEIVPPKKVSVIGRTQPILTNCIMARDLEKNFAAVEAFPVAVTNVDLTLRPAITLSGSVKNTEGAPVSVTEIGLGFVSHPYGYDIHPPFKANEQGQFSIPALPQGTEYWISGITAKGYGSSTAIVKAKDTQTNHYEFPTFVLKHANQILAGRVLDSNGKPVAGAEVYFRGYGQPLEPMDSETKTDGEGKFFTDTVCEGEVRVSAEFLGPPFMSGGAGTQVQAGNTNVVIRIHR